MSARRIRSAVANEPEQFGWNEAGTCEGCGASPVLCRRSLRDDWKVMCCDCRPLGQADAPTPETLRALSDTAQAATIPPAESSTLVPKSSLTEDA